jgi:serine protease Do
MKKFGILILAAILGSGITLGVYQFIDKKNDTRALPELAYNMPVKSAVFTLDKKGEIVPLDFTSIAEDVMDAVVHIKSTQIIRSQRQNPQQNPYYDFFEHFFGPEFRPQRPQQGPQERVGAGSGVIISADGYIVTNNHVVDKADEVEVTLHDNRNYKAKVVGTDPSTDLALLQIKEEGLPFLPFLDSDVIKVGEWVLAVGNPFNLNSTVTAGIVSAKGRNINILGQSAIESFIQTDAAINPGNSGGALVNLQGGLIGVNTAIASPTGSYAGYGFAVPSNLVKKVVYDIMEYGSVQRGYLGVFIRDINAELAKEKGLSISRGVYVDSLMQDGSAKEAGIKEGDIILKVGDAVVNTAPELQEQIARHRPGDKVDVLISRSGKEKSYNITLKGREGEKKIARESEKGVLEQLGVELKPLDKERAQQLGIKGGLEVTALKQGILSRETSIKKGFIITGVNNKSVTTEKELVETLEKLEGGVMLEGVYENYPGTLYYAFGMK